MVHLASRSGEPFPANIRSTALCWDVPASHELGLLVQPSLVLQSYNQSCNTNKWKTNILGSGYLSGSLTILRAYSFLSIVCCT